MQQPDLYLFTSIMKEALSCDVSIRPRLLASVSRSGKFSEYMDFLLNQLSSNQEPIVKEKILSLIIDMIVIKKTCISHFNSKQVGILTRTIVEYRCSLDNAKIFENIRFVLSELFQKFEESQNVLEFITSPPGFLSLYAVVVYSIVKPSVALKVFTKLLQSLEQPSALGLMAIVLFFESFRFKDLGESSEGEYREFGGDDKLVDIIKPLFISEDLVKKLGLKLIKGLFHFFTPDTSVSLFKKLADPVLSILENGNDELKTEIAYVFASLPSECSDEVLSKDLQLRSYIKPLAKCSCQIDSEYAKSLFKYVKPRKGIEAFYDIVSDLFLDVKLCRMAIFLAARFNMYSARANFVDLSFPPQVTDLTRTISGLDVIPYLIKKGKVTSELFVSISRFLDSVFQNAALLKNNLIRPIIFENIKNYVNLYRKYPDKFADSFLDLSINLRDPELISCFCSELKSCFISLQAVNIPLPSQEKFVYFFIYFSSFFMRNHENIDGFTTFLRVFNPSVKEDHKNFCQMIDNLVPQAYVNLIKSELAKYCEKNPFYAIPYAYLPSLFNSDINIITHIATNTAKSEKEDNEVNSALFLSVFKALSYRYLGDTLDCLYSLASEKEKSSFLFFGKKKKEFQVSIKRVILLSVADILQSGHVLSEVFQDTVYKIITNALPDADNIQTCVNEASKLIDIFPLLKDAVAPIPLLEKVVSVPLFAECLPYILTTQKNAAKFVEEVIMSWLFHLSLYTISINKNKDIAELLFRIAPAVSTVTHIFNHSLKHFNDDYVLPFIDFAHNCLVKAAENQIKIDIKNKVRYLVISAHLCLSYVKEIRFSAYHSLMILFEIPNNFKDDEPLKEAYLELSPEAEERTAIHLFNQIAKISDKELTKVFIEVIVSQKEISFSTSLILRGFFECNGPFILTTIPTCVLSILALVAKSEGKTGYQLNRAILDLSQMSMKEFLPVLISSSDINYKRELVGRLLQDESSRVKFFEQFNILLASFTSNISLFQIMPAVVHSEKSQDIPSKTFGFLMSSLIIWMSSLYSNQKSLSRSEIKSTKEEISECISFLFRGTNLAAVPIIEVDISNISTYATTLQQLTEHLTNLDIERITSVCQALGNLINNKNPELKLTAALIFIYLQGVFGLCTNLSAVQLAYKLHESIALSFREASPEYCSFIAKVFDSTIFSAHIEKLKGDNALIIFNSIIESLCNEKLHYQSNSLNVLTLILPLISKEALEDSAKHLLSALRVVAVSMSFSMQLLDLIELFVSLDPSFHNFAHNKTLNVIYLIRLLSHQRQDVRSRTSAILEKIIHNLKNEKGLQSILSSKELASFGNAIVSAIIPKDVTKEVIELIQEVCSALASDETTEVMEFRTKVISKAIEIYTNEQISGQAQELLRICLP